MPSCAACMQQARVYMPIDRRRRRRTPAAATMIFALVKSVTAFRIGVTTRQHGRSRLFSSTHQQCVTSLHNMPSPVETMELRGNFHIFIKRDDQLDLFGQGVHGNKARKLFFLGRMEETELPEAFVSFGGVQSNAMAALAGIVRGHLKRPMIYYTKGPIPSWLLANPAGNYLRALSKGVEFRQMARDEFAEAFEKFEDEASIPVQSLGLPYKRTMVVPQGGATAGAEEGVKMLADEIADFWRSYCSAQGQKGEGRSLAVVLPSGTGTTALYLAKHLHNQAAGCMRVYAVPCCGDGVYLTKQMSRLSGAPQEGERRPTILQGTVKAPVFAKPDPRMVAMWTEAKGAGLLLDLIYGPLAMEVMLDNVDRLWGQHSHVMYVHTGGLEGLPSQLARYRHLGLIG